MKRLVEKNQVLKNWDKGPERRIIIIREVISSPQCFTHQEVVGISTCDKVFRR